MKEIYTQHTINQFFEEFKNLPYSYKIEKVHQLLNNPNAKATHKINSHLYHLKLIIMTSAFIVGVATLFLWVVPKNSNTDDIAESFTDKPATKVQSNIDPDIEIESIQYNMNSDKLNIQEVENNNPQKDKPLLASNGYRKGNAKTKQTNIEKDTVSSTRFRSVNTNIDDLNSGAGPKQVEKTQTYILYGQDAGRKVNLPDFNKLMVHTHCEINIWQDDSCQIRIEAKEDIRSRLQVKVEDNTLKITSTNKIKRYEKCKIYVSVKSLVYIEGKNRTSIHSDNNLKGDTLRISTSNSSGINIGLEMNVLILKCQGASDAVLRGTVNHLDARNSGASDIRAYKLSCRICKLKSSGASDVKINVTDKLEVSASGASDIYFKGNPELNVIRNSGASGIHHRN